METSSSPVPKAKTTTYPEPLIEHPIAEHKQTIILLHGRGSNAKSFGPELLSTPIEGLGCLRTAFPSAKFIFPTASKRRAKIFKRIPINQWFDNWSPLEPVKHEKIQIEGLRESSQYIHALLKDEIDAVGAENIVLGGLSQGCATSLMSLLLWEGEQFAAVVGMCGWLPLRAHLDVLLRDGTQDEAEEDGISDVFGDADEHADVLKRKCLDGDQTHENDDDVNKQNIANKLTQAVSFLREELEVAHGNSPIRPAVSKVPIFLGHGTEDKTVPIARGNEARDCLTAMDLTVQWKEYEKLGHWYSGDMLRDLVSFIDENTTWDNRERGVQIPMM